MVACLRSDGVLQELWFLPPGKTIERHSAPSRTTLFLNKDIGGVSDTVGFEQLGLIGYGLNTAYRTP